MIKVSRNLARGREIKNPKELKTFKAPSVARLKIDGTYSVLPVAFVSGFPIRMFFFSKFYWTKKYE